MVSQCSLVGNQSTPIVLKMRGLTRAVRAESFIQSASLSAKLMGQSSQQTLSCMFSVACRQPDLSQSARKRSLKSVWSSYFSLFFSRLKNSTSVWLIRCLCMFSWQVYKDNDCSFEINITIWLAMFILSMAYCSVLIYFTVHIIF